jgi:hypothetical protein
LLPRSHILWPKSALRQFRLGARDIPDNAERMSCEVCAARDKRDGERDKRDGERAMLVAGAAVVVCMVLSYGVAWWNGCPLMSHDAGVAALRAAVRANNATRVCWLVDRCGVSTDAVRAALPADAWSEGALDTAIITHSAAITALLLDRYSFCMPARAHTQCTALGVPSNK